MFGWLSTIRKHAIHECPTPPEILVRVIGTLQGYSIWEVRKCVGCGECSEWRRDHQGESFRVHSRPVPENFLEDLRGKHA
jgi:hypothetical protein